MKRYVESRMIAIADPFTVNVPLKRKRKRKKKNLLLLYLLGILSRKGSANCLARIKFAERTAYAYTCFPFYKFARVYLRSSLALRIREIQSLRWSAKSRDGPTSFITLAKLRKSNEERRD